MQRCRTLKSANEVFASGVWGTDLGLDILQAFPELCQLRRCYQYHVELDDHQARKFEVLECDVVDQRQSSHVTMLLTYIVFFQDFSQIAEYTFRIQVEA